MEALSQIEPAGVQRLRLTRRLSELLDAGRQTADDVTASERGLHGRGRQPAFKIIKHATRFEASDDLELVKLRITHHQDRMIGIAERPVQSLRVRA
jgi:hypothetical protein